MIGSAFALRGYRGLKPSGVTGGASAAAGLSWVEDIKGETGRDKVLFSFQRSRTAKHAHCLQAPRRSARETNLWLTADFWLYCENRTDSDTFHLSHTSSYLSYIHLVCPPFSSGRAPAMTCEKRHN